MIFVGSWGWIWGSPDSYRQKVEKVVWYRRHDMSWLASFWTRPRERETAASTPAQIDAESGASGEHSSVRHRQPSMPASTDSDS